MVCLSRRRLDGSCGKFPNLRCASITQLFDKDEQFINYLRADNSLNQQ